VYLYVYRWNPYEEKAEFQNKFLTTLLELDKLGFQTAQSLVKSGHAWFNQKNMDTVCNLLGWAHYTPNTECKKCNNFKFIPMMNFYTGCAICNGKDNGSYTYFEASERSKKES